MCSRPLSGNDKVKIRYGMPLQLQHVMSGRFVRVLSAAAPGDPECRSLSLDTRPGTVDCCFKLMPRFKAQTEGSIVYYDDSMVIESLMQRENYLHTSPVRTSTDSPDSTEAPVALAGLHALLVSSRLLTSVLFFRPHLFPP
jgi:hypothetical protein